MRRTIRKMLERVGGAGARAGSPAGTPGGFTLIELLIAVAALAVVAAGVAAIFEATGRTIQAGKRVSAYNAYANLIQRQMAADFANMTRDGFLIIRNEYATATPNPYPTIGLPGLPNIDAVPLDESDQHPRLRRIDEIMFFAKGKFTSLRELLDPRFAVDSDAAAIYYGHGQKALPPVNGYDPNSHYYNPSVNDTGAFLDPVGESRLGYYNAAAAVPNPNRFASDWILVRHVTLLRPAQTSPTPIPNPTPFGLSQQQMADGDVQVSLQPAASNLFRSLASIFPVARPAALVRSSFDTGAGSPQLASALVDIATTDLSEIGLIVMTADKGPGAAGPTFFVPGQNNGPDGNNAGVDGVYTIANTGNGGDSNRLALTQAWMDDAPPAWSMAQNPTNRSRIRCESAPNNYLGILGGAYGTREEPACRRADQLMLAGSNFLPRCTEFIVEWSFGHQYTSDPNGTVNPPNPYDPVHAGQLVWYGLNRQINGQTVASFYLDARYPWNVPETVKYTQVNGTVANWISGGQANPVGLIHGQNFNAAQQIGNPGQPLTSYFGYVDPTFNPDLDAPPGVIPPDGKLISPLDSRSPTVPWPWPKLIRVTLSLADPNDPSIEQSFQFVFEVPAAAQ